MHRKRTMPSWDEVIDTPLEAVIPTAVVEQAITHVALVEQTTPEFWPAVMKYVSRPEYPRLLNVLYVMSVCRKNAEYVNSNEFLEWAKGNKDLPL